MYFKAFLVLMAFYLVVGCGDSRSLELVWSVRGGRVGQWGILGEEIIAVGQYLSAYSLSTGKTLRQVKLPEDYGNTTAGKLSLSIAITDFGLVFGWYGFDAEAGKVFCYDANSLTLRWERTFPLRKSPSGSYPTFSITVDRNYVYVLLIGNEGPNLFKLRLSDGQTAWSTRIEKYIQGVPLILQDGKLLIRSRVSPWSRESYGYFQAINPETGETLWRVRIDGGFLVSDDVPLISGNRAYVTSEGSAPDITHLYTVDVKKGTIVKHQLLRRLRPPFAEHDGTLYFGSSRPASYHSDREELLWQINLHGEDGLGSPVVANGVLDPIRQEIYLGDWERYIYVLYSTTGQVKERINIRRYFRGDFLFSPVKAFFGSYGVKRLELNQGFLLVGTVDSSLFVFRQKNPE